MKNQVKEEKEKQKGGSYKVYLCVARVFECVCCASKRSQPF